MEKHSKTHNMTRASVNRINEEIFVFKKMSTCVTLGYRNVAILFCTFLIESFTKIHNQMYKIGIS